MALLAVTGITRRAGITAVVALAAPAVVVAAVAALVEHDRRLQAGATTRQHQDHEHNERQPQPAVHIPDFCHDTSPPVSLSALQPPRLYIVGGLCAGSPSEDWTNTSWMGLSSLLNWN